MAVMRIGRTRVLPPSTRASVVDIPCRRSRSTRSSSTIAFVTTIPISIRIPMRALMPIARSVSSRAGKTPIAASGRLNMITNGVIRLLKARTIIT